MAHLKPGLGASKTSPLLALPICSTLSSLPDQPPSPFHLPPPSDPLQAALLPEGTALPDHTTALVSVFNPNSFA